MVEGRAKIISNVEVAPGFFRIALEAPEVAAEAKAGQFAMVRVSEGTEPLLRRPFSFHRIRKGGFEFLYKVVGTGTKILSQRSNGEMLSILGPLGKGFDIRSKVEGRRSKVVVAGGIGVAPLVGLVEQIKDAGSQAVVFIGAKTKGHLLCEDDFKRLGAEVHVATEDGSVGYKGLVTELLEDDRLLRPPIDRLKRARNDGVGRARNDGVGRARNDGVGRARNDGVRLAIFACGPRPMLRAVWQFAKSKKIPCQVSLEENMACGTGACLGCAIETKEGYKMVCKDGPVFDAGDILWR